MYNDYHNNYYITDINTVIHLNGKLIYFKMYFFYSYQWAHIIS